MTWLLLALAPAFAQAPDWTLCAVCSKDVEETDALEAVWACGEQTHGAWRWSEFVRTRPSNPSTVLAGVTWHHKPERVQKQLDDGVIDGDLVRGVLPSGFPVAVEYWGADTPDKEGVSHIRLPLLSPDDPRCAAVRCAPCEAGLAAVADERRKAEDAALALPLFERYERGRDGETTPEEWIRLLSRAGWTVEGHRWIPPDSDWQVLMSADLVPEGLSMRIDGDAMPLGLEQGSITALRARYGEPWVEPPEGELLLVDHMVGKAVRLLFADDGSRVREVIWLDDDAPPELPGSWGQYCPVDYKCRTSDGYTLEGRFEDGRFVAGRVRDVDFREVAIVAPPPKTPEELAAEAVARAEAERAARSARVALPAQYANDMLDQLASARESTSSRARLVRNAEKALAMARWEAEAFVERCPDQSPAIGPAKGILDRAHGIGGDVVASQAAMEQAGPAFIAAWNDLQPALAACLGVDAPTAVVALALPDGSGPETMLHAALGVRARPPAGWTCDSAQHTCRSAAGHLYVRRYNLDSDGLDGLVGRLWDEAEGGCAPVAEAPGGAALLCGAEGDGRVLHRLLETSGVVVDLHLSTGRWSEARGQEWRALLDATEVRGQRATLSALPAGPLERPPGPDWSGIDFSASAGPAERAHVIAKVWHVDRARGPICSNVSVRLPADWDAWATRHEAAWAVLARDGYQLISVDVLATPSADMDGFVKGGCDDFGTIRK